MGYRQLAVSGGEPLLYSRLADLLAEARRLGFVTTLTTNGLLLNGSRWQRMAPMVDVVAVSIDGDPDTHDALRRQWGSRRRTADNLRTLRDAGSAFSLIFTLTQYNVDQLEGVVTLAANAGAVAVQVHPLSAHGRAEQTMAEAVPDSTELLAALIEAKRLAREYGISVHVDVLTADQISRFRDHLVPTLPAALPSDLLPILIVEADGAVVPLVHGLREQFAIGVLGRERLREQLPRWAQGTGGASIAELCARTWSELTETRHEPVVYWWGALVAHSTRVRCADRSTSILQHSPADRPGVLCL